MHGMCDDLGPYYGLNRALFFLLVAALLLLCVVRVSCGEYIQHHAIGLDRQWSPYLVAQGPAKADTTGPFHTGPGGDISFWALKDYPISIFPRDEPTSGVPEPPPRDPPTTRSKRRCGSGSWLLAGPLIYFRVRSLVGRDSERA